MRLFQTLSAALILHASCLCAFAQDDGNDHVRIEVVSIAGSTAVAKLFWKVYPENLYFKDLTPAQRKRVDAQYEQIAEGDEPPYPVEGINAITKRLLVHAINERRSGLASVVVEVDSVGHPHNARVLGASDIGVARLLAAVMLTTRFKPARCSGQACVMDFPVTVEAALPWRN